MKNIIKNLKENKWIHYILIIIVGIILSIPLCKIQIRDSHDGSLHYLRILGTVDTLKIGQFPPLINQNFCKGAGYSMNLFYPPLVTYLPLIIKLFTSSYMEALKIFGGIAICVSGLTMYHFTYSVTRKRTIALLSAFFYLIAPYKLANVYKRYAIGEFTAMIFMPLVFLGMYNLFEQDGKKHYYIAIGAVGLMLSHTVTTLYTALFCVIYILFNITKLKQKDIIKKCIVNVLFILLISALFWLPLLEAKTMADYAILNDQIMRTYGEFAYDNTIHFSQLFKNIGEEDGTTFLLGIPTILAIIFIPFVEKKVDDKYKSFYLINIIFSLITLFMCSKFFPWIIMPNIICKLQYPWRMLGFFNFFISFICGINLYIVLEQLVRKEILQIAAIILFVAISIISSITIESQFFATDKTLDEKYEKSITNNKKISHLAINRDYMPLKAIVLQKTYVLVRKDKTYILNGKADIENEDKQDLNDKINIKNAEKNTELEFPYYYYPGYKAYLETNNEVIKLDLKESEHGYLSCILPEEIENGTINIHYTGTFITYFSYVLSFISFILFIVYIAFFKNKNKNKDEKK